MIYLFFKKVPNGLGFFKSYMEPQSSNKGGPIQSPSLWLFYSCFVFKVSAAFVKIFNLKNGIPMDVKFILIVFSYLKKNVRTCVRYSLPGELLPRPCNLFNRLLYRKRLLGSLNSVTY